MKESTWMKKKDVNDMYVSEKYANQKSIQIKIIGMKSTQIKKSIRMKSIRIENSTVWKTAMKNVSLTKPNGECSQTNKKVVLSDSKCTWSNANLGYGSVTIQLSHGWITWANAYNTVKW